MSVLQELPFDEGALVIADLHLDVQDEPGLEGFLSWLAALSDVPQLLILGDLFEFWVGPAQLQMPGARRITDALAKLLDDF